MNRRLTMTATSGDGVKTPRAAVATAWVAIISLAAAAVLVIWLRYDTSSAPWQDPIVTGASVLGSLLAALTSALALLTARQAGAAVRTANASQVAALATQQVSISAQRSNDEARLEEVTRGREAYGPSAGSGGQGNSAGRASPYSADATGPSHGDEFDTGEVPIVFPYSGDEEASVSHGFGRGEASATEDIDDDAEPRPWSGVGSAGPTPPAVTRLPGHAQPSWGPPQPYPKVTYGGLPDEESVLRARIASADRMLELIEKTLASNTGR
jgi:hypothetical protein